MTVKARAGHLVTDGCALVCYDSVQVLPQSRRTEALSSVPSAFLLPSWPVPTQLLTSLGVRLCSERLSALSDCFVVYFDLGQKAWNSGWGPQEGPGASPLLLAALVDVKGLSS